MDWYTIENSYFWIGVSGKFKSWTFRIRNPLSTKIVEFRVHKQVINLVAEDTEDEKKILKKRNEREAKRKLNEEWKKQVILEEKKWFKQDRENANERAKTLAKTLELQRGSMGSESRE